MPTLEQKVRLLTGETPFTTYDIPELGVRALALSDGPIGIRGIAEPAPVAAQLPNPSAVAASWDLDLVARLGALLGREARRLGIDVVLAPVVNLQRTPVAGRHFEMYSEDPLLTSDVMVAFVRAVQAEGVGVCVKHFVGNESETERTSYLARVGEQALREVYLAPFEAAVKRAGVWSIMAAYNRVDAGGEAAHATDHSYLINTVLKGEWGFDGVVVSDWLATKTTVESALGGLDLVMPGPGGPWEQQLVDAVRAGLVPESVIDDKVARIQRLAARVDTLRDAADGRSSGTALRDGRSAPSSGTALRDGRSAPSSGATPPAAEEPAERASRSPHAPAAPDSDEVRSLLREAVARATVVLQNRDGVLPLDAASVNSIALIGPNATEPFVQGGGSAVVNAPYGVDVAQALRAAFPDAQVTVHRGGPARRFAPLIDPALVTAAEGEAGYRLQLLDAAGDPVGEPRLVPADEGWNRGVPRGAERAIVHARVSLSGAGRHRVEVGAVGIRRIWFDDELVDESDEFADENVILDSSANRPAGPSRVYELAEGEERTVEIRLEGQVVDAGAYSRFVRFELRHDADAADVAAEIDEAVRAAAAADVAIVIVGTDEETESEGWDRTSLALPGRQDELVTRVAAANPRTVAVVNAGAPVILPWLDDVPAALWWWLPGQEGAGGLVDALSGAVEPSGRLPWTLPGSEADVPVPDAVPVDGVVDYREGVHIGYRGWRRLGRVPARPFGYGQGYADFAIAAPLVAEEWDGDRLPVTVAVTNRSLRDGRAVVQFYLSGPAAEHGEFDRPERWFAGFGTLDVKADRVAALTVRLPLRAFQVWSVDEQRWVLPHGEYVLRAASDALDDGAAVTITL
ncbi:beta-glucosidase family protein [Gryllotalpicola ginsengisoli]|uniref:beta-glucosidase family protein n=1 Tax=Gryllotalpicola ginsengisoli TaxID=444608 RepID=UPI0003B4DC92|nr:glycoside hydrolase family 3 C-terminal domain-containing protein [Gryllotalpicola ginsengisoli]